MKKIITESVPVDNKAALEAEAYESEYKKTRKL